MQRTHNKRNAFTLVELLVVIAIIGLLMGLLIPVVGGVLRRAKNTRLRVELAQIDQAIEEYKNRYGDYPPDFSDEAIVARHYRKLFPKINRQELDLLANCMRSDGNNDGDLADPEDFSGHEVDRAEALVFVLGGYSKDPARPFTGVGGPFEIIDENASRTSPLNFQINTSRENSLFDFPTDRLTIYATNNRYLSRDETDYQVRVYSRSNSAVLARQNDLFPVFKGIGLNAPYVYFDSRTYASSLSGNNIYATENVGNIRPYSTEEAILEGGTVQGYKPANANTFQVISPGLDDRFGNVTSSTGTRTGFPYYFVYPTGRTYIFEPGNLRFDGKAYEEGDLNEHQDNLTNFAKGVLSDDLP